MVNLMDDGDEYDCDGGDCSKLRRWTVVKDGMNDGSDDGDVINRGSSSSKLAFSFDGIEEDNDGGG